MNAVKVQDRVNDLANRIEEIKTLLMVTCEHYFNGDEPPDIPGLLNAQYKHFALLVNFATNLLCGVERESRKLHDEIL